MEEKDFDVGKLYSMPTPCYPPRKIIEIEIDAHGASYKYVCNDIEKICADHKKSELHIKVCNLQPSYETNSSDSATKKPFHCTEETVKKMIIEELDKRAAENLKTICPTELLTKLQAKFPYLKPDSHESPILQD